jgi:putative phosphoesterase
MLIAVMSDSHDNIWNLRKVMEISKQERVGTIIHCGDFVAPFMLKELAAADVPVHGVFGNNDGDQHTLTRLATSEFPDIHLHGHFGEISIDGQSIAFTHYDFFAEGLIATGNYKLVAFGHSHVYDFKNVDGNILLNPGEVMGKEGSPGFCLVDTDIWEIKRVEIY